MADDLLDDDADNDDQLNLLYTSGHGWMNVREIFAWTRDESE